jgi:hypothetical protein
VEETAAAADVAGTDAVGDADAWGSRKPGASNVAAEDSPYARRDDRSRPERPGGEHTGHTGSARPVAGGIVDSPGDGAIDDDVAWEKNEQAERFAEYAIALPADDGSSCRRLTRWRWSPHVNQI